MFGTSSLVDKNAHTLAPWPDCSDAGTTEPDLCRKKKHIHVSCFLCRRPQIWWQSSCHFNRILPCQMAFQQNKPWTSSSSGSCRRWGPRRQGFDSYTDSLQNDSYSKQLRNLYMLFPRGHLLVNSLFKPLRVWNSDCDSCQVILKDNIEYSGRRLRASAERRTGSKPFLCLVFQETKPRQAANTDDAGDWAELALLLLQGHFFSTEQLVFPNWSPVNPKLVHVQIIAFIWKYHWYFLFLPELMCNKGDNCTAINQFRLFFLGQNTHKHTFQRIIPPNRFSCSTNNQYNWTSKAFYN